jgi:hypothetical protein
MAEYTRSSISPPLPLLLLSLSAHRLSHPTSCAPRLDLDLRIRLRLLSIIPELRNACVLQPAGMRRRHRTSRIAQALRAQPIVGSNAIRNGSDGRGR